MQLIGRTKEKRLFDEIIGSPEAEFVGVVGRRRVGKTYLIREYLKDKAEIFFYITGEKGVKLPIQLATFRKEINRVFNNGSEETRVDKKTPSTWRGVFNELFEELERYYSTRPNKPQLILFFDELPWLDTPRSGFLAALDSFWNTKLSTLPRVKLIVCGSAASWMVTKLFNATGGLHNRLTRRITLFPFTLSETELFLKERGINWNRNEILEAYLIFGGIPYYLAQLQGSLSLSQNVGRICFEKGVGLFDEFKILFTSLFQNGELYESIVRQIATKRTGLSLEEISQKTELSRGGMLTKRLSDLEYAGFIQSFVPFGRKTKERYFRICDPFIWFSLNWIEQLRNTPFSPGTGERQWQQLATTQRYQIWKGYVFETVCMYHEYEIRRALNIDSTLSFPGTFRRISKNKQEEGCQIDLLFDRADGVITLCELKYSKEDFEFDRKLAEDLKTRMRVFEDLTKTKKRLSWTLILPTALKKNTWSEGLIDSVINIDSLFVERN
jgi:predicted AAA+ superfamily ATPase